MHPGKVIATKFELIEGIYDIFVSWHNVNGVKTVKGKVLTAYWINIVSIFA